MFDNAIHPYGIRPARTHPPIPRIERDLPRALITFEDETAKLDVTPRILETPAELKDLLSPDGFVRIPAGKYATRFVMPIPPWGTEYTSERSVTLERDFYAHKTEVTWEQWNEVREWGMKHGYPDLSPGREGYRKQEGASHLPVTEVSWMDAVKWLNAASEMYGLEPCYFPADNPDEIFRQGVHGRIECDWGANGFRLPTFAEAMAMDSETIVDSKGTHNWLGYPKHPVATKPANGWGLHDVGGNANEWCWDSRIEREDRPGESYYRIATHEEFIGISRVEFDDDYRFFTIPSGYRYPNLGFRAVRGVIP